MGAAPDAGHPAVQAFLGQPLSCRVLTAFAAQLQSFQGQLCRTQQTDAQHGRCDQGFDQGHALLGAFGAFHGVLAVQLPLTR